MYLYEHTQWTAFTWDDSVILPLVSAVRFAQGRLLGEAAYLGFEIGAQTELETLTEEILASSQIEGVNLSKQEVRSSVSKQLGLVLPEPSPETHGVDGVVDIMFDATRHAEEPVTSERLCAWHAALFPTGRSGLQVLSVGEFRAGKMEVVSGVIGKERIHFEAPPAHDLKRYMDEFIYWLNNDMSVEALVKAGLAHLWFLTIHPFEDGNGRIARALTELLLARSDGESRRFYSMAKQILSTRKEYYQILEKTQRGDSNATDWLAWFFSVLLSALEASSNELQAVLKRSAFWQQLDAVTLNDRQRSMLRKLQGNFVGKLTTDKWAKINKVSADTALRDINDLIEKGVLVKDIGGGRSTSYRLS